MSFPYVPGFDLSGTVVKLGEGVTNLAVGDEVMVVVDVVVVIGWLVHGG